MFKKIKNVLLSKVFIIICVMFILVILSLLFWIYGSLIAFNDIHIFGNSFLRGAIIVLLWIFLFIIFLLKKTINFIKSINNENKKKLQELKNEAKEFIKKTKRNFSISFKDAKNTWKKEVKFGNIPVIMVIGNESAGKSSFINYSGMDYPISDSLNLYKKTHLSTRNFSLYISKKGALIDTEGGYFVQEEHFNPENSDEMPEDDLIKNKDFLLKKIVWKSFLKFLNARKFYKKLNGIVLVIDTEALLNSSKEESENMVRYFVRRIGECESNLNLNLPIYIVFSKLDLIEGMGEFLKHYSDNIAPKPLGITIPKGFNKNNSHKEFFHQEFKELSDSLMYSIMAKNSFSYDIKEKRKSYLFLKQLDNIFNIAQNFIEKINIENMLKNKSFLRGVYFVSSFQENIPKNFLLDAVCLKHSLNPVVTKPANNINKQSYFIKALLEDIVFKDKALSHSILGNIGRKLSVFGLLLGIIVITYGISTYYLDSKEIQKQNLTNTLTDLSSILNEIEKKYHASSIKEKARYIQDLRNILIEYPQLFEDKSYFDYIFLNISYSGLKPARELYAKMVENLLQQTLVASLETSIKQENDGGRLIRDLYVYRSLYDKAHFNKELIRVWVKNNWKGFEKYQIPQNNFLTYLNDLSDKSVFTTSKENEQIIALGREKLDRFTRAQRLYSLLFFAIYSDKSNVFYNMKEDIGISFDDVFDTSSTSKKFYLVETAYTRNGIENLLSNITKYISDTAKIETWLLGAQASKADNDEISLSMGIIKLYLQEYQQKWQNILDGIKPKPFYTNEVGLIELGILSKKSNPIKNLIGIVSKNTKLDDNALLKHASNLGLPTAEIKNSFVSLANAFDIYHKMAAQDSLFTSGINTLGSKVGMDVSHQSIMDNLSVDIQNIYKKIVDFTSGNGNSEEKILYALKKSNIQEDPFTKLNADASSLPNELAIYYEDLSAYAWKLIELRAGIELNKAWNKELYLPFMNEIASYYPININSKESMKMDMLKNFFGKNGIWNKFFSKYLNQVLIKRGNNYYMDPNYASKLNFSQNFLNTVSKMAIISNVILNENDNLNINFFIKTAGLSGDFGSIAITYDDKKMIYDQTFPSKLDIIADNFKASTKFKINAIDYKGAIKYSKTYEGEWGWLRFLQDSKKEQNRIRSLYFNNNKNLYFDYFIDGGEEVVNQALAILPNLVLPQSISGE
ncbi:hypothetical protein BKH41_08680 [Helicobacter sp. 12S02232-10]|uniref:type VI secretion system membrane subunit TssM n=1 Tax=Helicobacter sp. 12S02232-10 TaxID=1476197 RepID=UPI000BA5BF3C|nr:type VI secretion system membrane subunit TssM [Helicobacter sp. 12S02232-10]PAF46721.1 hypothetical protein BKH41_08680 [Helicobacter sp. 12S02232-10]